MKNVKDTNPSYDQDKSQRTVGEQQSGDSLNDPSIDPNSGGPRIDGEVMEAEASARSVNATGTPSDGKKSAVGWNDSNAPSASFEEEE
ncbi:MAG: hypothetical protein HKO13_01130 [Sphingomonas sp.]|nr:hypothetical protein [Sphingomonas sp.]